MELIGKAVPDRHAGVLCQFLDDGLAEAAVLDPLEHPSQHPRGVLDALLLPDLGAGRVKIGRPHPQIMGRHLKGAAGPGAGLLEDQRHIPAFKRIDALMMLLSVLQKRSEIQKIHDLLSFLSLQPSLSLCLVHQDTRGHRRVQRFDPAHHRDADQRTGCPRCLIRDAVSFIADDKCTP